MKKILYSLTPLLLIIAILFSTYGWLQGLDNPGYVLVGIGEWSLETTATVFIISLLASFVVFHIILRSLSWLWRLPQQIKQRGTKVKFDRSQEALIAGLVDSAEGNWQRAEDVLIKHVSHSGAPLIHYLTAAKAAQSRGAFDKRDEYLQQAAAQAPDASITIGLTQAELHLSGKQFNQALETLSKLHSIDANHASVLRLLHQTYQHIGDWEGIRKLLPSLHKNKVLMEAEIKLLETEAFSRLLKQSAETGDADAIQALWIEVPNYIKRVTGVSAIYFAAMINAGASATIEDELTATLATNWNKTLLSLFGSLVSTNPQRQLEMAEQWQAFHADDIILLNVLGKLSLQCADNEKAVGYLTRSLAIEPTVQAYQLLGDLSFTQGDKDRASQCYKNALELASSEIVSRIDTVS